MSALRVVIVGAGGKVGLHLSRILSKSGYAVDGIVRSEDKSSLVSETGARPVVLSVESDSVADFSRRFNGAHCVVWTAGAGGKGGAERTEAVDHQGALKVFDALEALDEDDRPRLILVSALGVRDHGKPEPAHWDNDDRERMRKSYEAIPCVVAFFYDAESLSGYYAAKFKADASLIRRNDLLYTILRPGGLSDDPPTGKVSLGQTHTTRTVPREDVAQVLATLVERESASGLALDLIGGDMPIAQAVDQAIARGKSDFEL